MGLKYEIETLDAVPEALREHYTEGEDKKYRLAVEGVVPKTKVDEFRQNNIKLLQERDTYQEQAKTLAEKYKDVDLDEYVRLKTGKGKGKGDDDVEAIVEERIKAYRTKHETELGTVKGQLEAKEAKLSTLLIDNALQSAAIAAGVAETAVDDVVRRGREMFRLKDDSVIPMANGQVVYGEDGLTPLSVKEWIGGLAASAPHLFKQSQGGGANNNGGGGSTQYRAKSDFKSASEKSKYISEHGMEAYVKLPASR